MMRRGQHYMRARDEDLRKKMIVFLEEHPNPDDELVHEWADNNGVIKDEAEAMLYRFATKFVKFLTEGRSQEKDFGEDDVSPDKLKKGTEVEREHVDDEVMQQKIALDHLAESLEYYEGLEKMEKEL